VGSHPSDLGSEHDADPFLLERRLQQLGRLRVDPRHQAVAALDDRHLGTEAPVELGELAPGDASTQDDQARRHAVRRGRVSRRPRLDRVQPVERRRDRGGPGCDDEAVVLDLLSVRLDHAGPRDVTGTADERDALAVQPRHLARIVPVGHLPVAPGEDLVRVERPCADAGSTVGRRP
jgi:hypothetical protein